MPDGSSLEFSDKKENSSYNDGTTDNFGGSPSITAAYEDSISRSNQKSNTLSIKNNEQNVNSSYDKLYMLKDINAGSGWNNKENSEKVLNYEIQDDIMKENQSIGSELNGYEQNHSSRELGWNGNFGEDERPGRMVGVGHIQPKTSDTPCTKRIHRRGVSAEVLTSSGLTAEQAMLRAQSELEGFSTEFYTDAKYGGVKKTTPFNTEHTIYYPDSTFERIGISVKNGVASFMEKRFNALA